MEHPTTGGSGEDGGAPEPLAAAFLQAPVGLAVTSTDGAFVVVNDALCELLGRDRHELTSLALGDLLAPEDLEELRAASEHLLRTGQPLQHRWYRLRHASGRPVTASLSWSVLEHPAGHRVGMVLHAEDVSHVQQRETELAHRALHDSLTGLANRVLFRDRLSHALGRLRRAPASLALLFLDVDNFKSVNDRYGHEEGDRVLAEAAHRLSSAVRPGDTVARYGGDEFVVLCEGAGRAEAAAVAARIADRFSAPIRTGSGAEITLSCSVGTAVTESAETGQDELLREADAAMYRVKARRAT